MSAPLLLRAFVNERLSAAADEIFQVFESTIAKYEEEAFSSKQEIERLRSLVLENNKKTTDFCQLITCKEETPPQMPHDEPGLHLLIDQGNPEPRHIKKEDHKLCDSQQQDEERAPEFKDADVSHLHQPSLWEKNEQEDRKPTLQPQTQDCEEQFQAWQANKIVRFVLPLASSLASQTHTENEEIQGDQRPAERCTPGQTQTELNQSFLITPRESTEFSHLNVVASDNHCCLCDRSFSSNLRLVNHAFRMHSKDSDVLCAVCGKTLESTDSLNVHLQSHKNSMCCHVCGKHYKRTTSLTDHIASHTGVKLHRCHICGKECRRKGDLKIHMRIHTGEKPFCCSYCCKSFTHSGHLKKHMRSHTGERPHRCEICGRGFLQSTHLKYHLGTHA